VGEAMEHFMIISLNFLHLLPSIVGGAETYAAGLIKGLAKIDKQNDYYVFVNRESATNGLYLIDLILIA
jgi:hypothetical protein